MHLTAFCRRLFPLFLASKMLVEIQAFWNQSRKDVSFVSKISKEKLILLSHILMTTSYRANLQKKRGLGVLVENWMNVRQPCTIVVMKAHQFLDCNGKNAGNWLRKDFFSSIQHLWNCIWNTMLRFGSFYYERYSNTLERAEDWITKMVRVVDQCTRGCGS